MTSKLQDEIPFAGWIITRDADCARGPRLPVRADFATYGVQVKARNVVTLAWEVEARPAGDPSANSSISTSVAMSLEAGSENTANYMISWSLHQLGKWTGRGPTPGSPLDMTSSPEGGIHKWI